MPISPKRFRVPDYREQREGYSVLDINGYSIAVDDEVADRILQQELTLAQSEYPPRYWHIHHPEHVPKTFEGRYVRLADWIGCGMRTPRTRKYEQVYFPSNPLDANDYRTHVVLQRRRASERTKAIPKRITIEQVEEGFVAVLPDGFRSKPSHTPTSAAIEVIDDELKLAYAEVARLRGERGRLSVHESKMEKELARWRRAIASEPLQIPAEFSNPQNPG